MYKFYQVIDVWNTILIYNFSITNLTSWLIYFLHWLLYYTCVWMYTIHRHWSTYSFVHVLHASRWHAEAPTERDQTPATGTEVAYDLLDLILCVKMCNYFYGRFFTHAFSRWWYVSGASHRAALTNRTCSWFNGAPQGPLLLPVETSGGPCTPQSFSVNLDTSMLPNNNSSNNHGCLLVGIFAASLISCLYLPVQQLSARHRV